jgi:hypothetical protein
VLAEGGGMLVKRWESEMFKSMQNYLLNASRICVMCTTLAVSFVPELGLAEDSSCEAVHAAQLNQLSVPYHGHSTVTLVPGRTELTEEIYTGKSLYIMHGGKWTMSPITSAEMREQQEENNKRKMACRAMRDETVDGVSATLYSVHAESDGIVLDAQMWISKSAGLPVIMKMSAIESHYVYTDVVAPSVH